jgi:hypothetical protein
MRMGAKVATLVGLGRRTPKAESTEG